MGNRRENMTPAIVIDLDETLVTVNTFHHFIKFTAKKVAKRLHFIALLRIGIAATLRLLRYFPHSAMKHTVMNIDAHTLSEAQLHDFAATIATYTNPKVAQIIDDAHRRGVKVILASAAPALYATHIAEISGCNHCIATEMPQRMKLTECRGERKKSRVEEYLDTEKLTLEAVITDHSDDIPLIKACLNRGGKVTLVSPDKKTTDKLKQQGIYSYTTI